MVTDNGGSSATQLVGVVVLSAAVIAALGLSVYAVVTARRAIFATPQPAAPETPQQARPAPYTPPPSNGRPQLKPEVIIDTGTAPAE